MVAPYSLKQAGANPGESAMQVRPPETVSNRVKKVQEKMQKLGFDVGIRVVCVAETKYVSEDQFLALRNASRLLFRQFSNPDLNSLVRTNTTAFGAAWRDPTNLVLYKVKNQMLNWYRLRIFYHPPFWYSTSLPKVIGLFVPSHKMNYPVMNVEEIATLFHFPGQVSQAPSFRRIESRVAKPPSNLPI